MRDFDETYNTSTPKASKTAVKLVSDMKHFVHIFDEEALAPQMETRDGPTEKTTTKMCDSVKELLAYIADLEEVVFDMNNLSCGLTFMQPGEVTKFYHLQGKARRALIARKKRGTKTKEEE